IGIDSRRAVWRLHSRTPRKPTAAQTAAIPMRSGAQPHRTTKPVQLDGITNRDATARITSGAQIRSRHAPAYRSGVDSRRPMSCSPPRNPGVMGLCRISISRRRIKVLGRSSTQTIFSDVRTFLDRTQRSSEVCANRLIVSRRLLYRERGGGGESETPIDLQSVEGTPGPPSHRRSAVPLRTRVPRGIVLAGDTGYGRDDSGGTRVVLCVRDQSDREQPHVRTIRGSRGRPREPVRVRL